MTNLMDKKITQYLFNIVLVINLIAYFKGSFKRPKPIPQVGTLRSTCRCCPRTSLSTVWFAETGSLRELTTALSVILVC
jgi:hypothetical protein